MRFDIHTHQSTLDDEIAIAIRSLYSDFAKAASGLVCSIGLHPWYLDDHERLFVELELYAGLPNVLAIGECGLDKVCETDWNLQVAVFKRQITLANRMNKPLIIHCVRAFEELIKIIEEAKPTVPVVVHGFNKKSTVADRFIEHGMYLSFGAAILNRESPAAAALQRIPADQFFLETDNSDVPIGEMYKAAAEIRQIDEEAVILQMQQNFNTVFKYNK